MSFLAWGFFIIGGFILFYIYNDNIREWVNNRFGAKLDQKKIEQEIENADIELTAVKTPVYRTDYTDDFLEQKKQERKTKVWNATFEAKNSELDVKDIFKFREHNDKLAEFQLDAQEIVNLKNRNEALYYKVVERAQAYKIRTSADIEKKQFDTLIEFMDNNIDFYKLSKEVQIAIINALTSINGGDNANSTYQDNRMKDANFRKANEEAKEKYYSNRKEKKRQDKEDSY